MSGGRGGGREKNTGPSTDVSFPFPLRRSNDMAIEFVIRHLFSLAHIEISNVNSHKFMLMMNLRSQRKHLISDGHTHDYAPKAKPTIISIASSC